MYTPHDPNCAARLPLADLFNPAGLALHAAALERGLTEAQKQVDELQLWLAN